jgi:hypothetical protein
MTAQIRTAILGEADGLVAARVQAICAFLARYAEDDRQLVFDILKATPRFSTLATEVGLARGARLAAIAGILPLEADNAARIDPQAEAACGLEQAGAPIAPPPEPETLFPEDTGKPRKPRKAAA